MNRRDRFGDPAPESVPPATTPHDPRCVNGWISTDREGHPAPCRVCKPWLAACPTCGASRTRCEFNRGQNGRCCPSCPHTSPVTIRRRGRTITTPTEEDR